MIMRWHLAGCCAVLLAALAACAPVATPSGPPAPAGTAKANCEREIWRRSGGAARITNVTIFEQQRGIISANGSFGTRYDCFTNAQGKAVNVTVDRRRRF